MTPLLMYALLAGATPMAAALTARALGKTRWMGKGGLASSVVLLGVSSGMLFAVATLDLVPEALAVAQGEALELSRWAVAGDDDGGGGEGDTLLEESLRGNAAQCVSIEAARAHDHLQERRMEAAVRFSMLGLFLGFMAMMLIEQALESVGGGHSHAEGGHAHGLEVVFEKERREEKAPPSAVLSKSMNTAVLAGLAVHAFVDGIMIAGAFKASSDIGVRVGVAVVIHKFPDGAMLSAILQQVALRRPAGRLWRFLPSMGLDSLWMLGVCSMTPLGVLVGSFILGGMPDMWLGAVLGFGAGTFLFITCVGILPELLKFDNKRLSLGCFVVGYLCFLFTDAVFSGPH